MKIPKPCTAYYYGGLPVKGQRRKGRLCIEQDQFFFDVPEHRGSEGIHLKVSPQDMDRIFLSRDNYYGSDTVLFNLTFRDKNGKSFTLRFAPIAIIPRRRIALQKEWLDFLTEAIQRKAAPLSEAGRNS
jgi:hypothetical protein